MRDARTASRLAAILGFVAALLAESAVVVRYLRTGHVDWAMAGAGLFIAAFALSAWTRAGRGSTGPSQGA